MRKVEMRESVELIDGPGGNSQKFLRKFVRFFLTLMCFYRVYE